MKCNVCGNEIPEGGKFCGKCGNKISETQENPEQQMNNNVPQKIETSVESNPQFNNVNSENETTTQYNQQFKFCINCGEKIDVNAEICPKCGVRVKNAVTEKSPILAAVLSLIVCGLGQIYNGQVRKGIILLVLYIISGILIMVLIGILFVIILWIYGIYDAYVSAQAINNGEILEDKLIP